MNYKEADVHIGSSKKISPTHARIEYSLAKVKQSIVVTHIATYLFHARVAIVL